MLAALSSYRFHASSLLITYEGWEDVNQQCDSKAVGVHIIDFAHCTFEQYNDKYTGPDTDCLHAIDNLISILNNISDPFPQ